MAVVLLGPIWNRVVSQTTETDGSGRPARNATDSGEFEFNGGTTTSGPGSSPTQRSDEPGVYTTVLGENLDASPSAWMELLFKLPTAPLTRDDFLRSRSRAGVRVWPESMDPPASATPLEELFGPLDVADQVRSSGPDAEVSGGAGPIDRPPAPDSAEPSSSTVETDGAEGHRTPEPRHPGERIKTAMDDARSTIQTIETALGVATDDTSTAGAGARLAGRTDAAAGTIPGLEQSVPESDEPVAAPTDDPRLPTRAIESAARRLDVRGGE